MTMQSITPMLRVDDYQRAKAFYCDRLGFSCMEEAGEPVVGFGIFCREGIRIFLHAWDGAGEAWNNWRAYVYVADMDGLVAELEGRGVRLSKSPYVTDYGMREFEIIDPDGNVLCFGTDPATDGA